MCVCPVCVPGHRPQHSGPHLPVHLPTRHTCYPSVITCTVHIPWLPTDSSPVQRCYSDESWSLPCPAISWPDQGTFKVTNPPMSLCTTDIIGYLIPSPTTYGSLLTHSCLASTDLTIITLCVSTIKLVHSRQHLSNAFGFTCHSPDSWDHNIMYT